jgi:hypothetical protein
MRKKLLAIGCIAVMLSACAEKVSQDDLIKGALKLRLDQWKETQLAQCRDEALQRAEIYVDSFLLASSLDMKLDTISATDKPIKPPKPVFKEKPDSLKVKEVIPEKK